jgi:valyl-tRNA synthetase
MQPHRAMNHLLTKDFIKSARAQGHGINVPLNSSRDVLHKAIMMTQYQTPIEQRQKMSQLISTINEATQKMKNKTIEKNMNKAINQIEKAALKIKNKKVIKEATEKRVKKKKSDQ